MRARIYNIFTCVYDTNRHSGISWTNLSGQHCSRTEDLIKSSIPVLTWSRCMESTMIDLAKMLWKITSCHNRSERLHLNSGHRISTRWGDGIKCSQSLWTGSIARFICPPPFFFLLRNPGLGLEWKGPVLQNNSLIGQTKRRKPDSKSSELSTATDTADKQRN